LKCFEECDITLKYFEEGMTIYDFLTFDHFKRSLKNPKVDFCFADVLINNGGMEPEIDVSSGSGVYVLPFLDSFLIYWFGGGVRFGDGNVFPLIVLSDDSVCGVLRLWSRTEQDPPLSLTGEVCLHDRGPDRVVWSREVGNGSEDGVGGGVGHCLVR